MVSVVQLRPQYDRDALVERALQFAEPLYAGQTLSTGEPAWPHALGLAAGVEKLHRLRVATRGSPREQNEILRKMVLGMVEDIRVVLIRLASRTQTLRWFAKNATDERAAYARETLDIYAPLANRLGVWQLKWELEDLSFRYLEPELYKKIAQMLDEKRLEREQNISNSMKNLEKELQKGGLKAQVTGRPKHIYSIWNKMRSKDLDFAQLHDVRALRVIVGSVKDCYGALGVVHTLWPPLPREFDDYVSRPKGNLYQSLHTAVTGPEGKTLEVQIRTEAMHRQAEFGIASHWQYKEKIKTSKDFGQKIAWLRQLLTWRDEIPLERPRLDDAIYVLTPQGKVIDLPAGATPIDFAYALHSDLGHRCRGARVDGRIVTLDTPLASGQRVEIAAAKSGGPSRDWLNPGRGFVRSPRARQKIRHWFNARAFAQTVAAGRAEVERVLRREGAAQANLEQLAAKLGFGGPDKLYAAVARDEVNLRQLQAAVRGADAPAAAPASLAPKKSRQGAAHGAILVVGMDRLLTQLARCCKPVPPDPVRGFVTRGRGVSVHREDCASLRRLAERHGERLVEAQWGRGGGAYAVDMAVTANDRPRLLRDIGDALARERINLTAARTQSRDELAFMRFAFDVADLAQLKRAFAAVREVAGVIRIARG